MNIKSLKQSNKGFTLVEICVTLVIFSILVTVSTMSLIHWQEYSVYTKQQENAENLYMAARNKIAQLRADNAWEDFKKSNFKNIEKCVFSESEYDSSSETYSKLYYAYCSIGSYNSYIHSSKVTDFKKNNNNTGAVFIFSLLSDYLYDKEILDYNIVVTFFDNGTIQAIYYSDRTNISLPNGYIDIEKLDKEHLYENSIGAYFSS